MKKVSLPESEEMIRKAKMTSRLSVLFFLLDFAVIGLIVFEIMQLFN